MFSSEVNPLEIWFKQSPKMFFFSFFSFILFSPLTHLSPQSITTIKTLGSGAYGTVYLARKKEDRGKRWITEEREEEGTLVAVKQFLQDKIIDLEATNLEAFLMTLVDHPNLVQLLGCCLEPPPLWLVIEYVPGKL